MAALGTPVRRRLIGIYALSGMLAGASGAITAQINGIVGLDSLGFPLSAEALVMLVLGGAGSLSGAVVGTSVFTLLHHTAASIDPYNWLFVIGAALMTVVLFPPAALMRKAWTRIRGQKVVQ
jgi:branched-chain amino acid transport system permease protein